MSRLVDKYFSYFVYSLVVPNILSKIPPPHVYMFYMFFLNVFFILGSLKLASVIFLSFIL